MDLTTMTEEEMIQLFKDNNFLEYWNLFSGEEKSFFVEKIISKLSIDDRKNLQNKIYPKPNPLDSIQSLKNSMKKWRESGYPIVDENTFWERLKICKGCEHWWSLSNTIIGFCKQCKCSTFKLSLSTEQCPLKNPKWRKII